PSDLGTRLTKPPRWSASPKPPPRLPATRPPSTRPTSPSACNACWWKPASLLAARKANPAPAARTPRRRRPRAETRHDQSQLPPPAADHGHHHRQRGGAWSAAAVDLFRPWDRGDVIGAGIGDSGFGIRDS